MRRSTLSDLAENLGLSVNTVSRALRGKDGVGTRTRDLVLEEAVRIGYITPGASRPGTEDAPSARSRSRTIGLTIPSSTHVFASELIGAIEAGARAAGYSLDLFVTEESASQETGIATQITDAGLAGAVVIPVQGERDPWARVRAEGIPVVAVSREIDQLSCDFVGVDSEAGEYAAVRHLLSRGARSIVSFEEDLAISTIANRQRGFARALAEVAGTTSRTVPVPSRRFETGESDWRPEEAYRACREFLDTDTAFDAVTVGDDYFALGVARALAERGIRVPDDVRMVGYGDHAYSAWMRPSLSSVRLPTRLIGELAVSLVLQRVAGETSPPVRRLIKPELVVRESSGPRPVTAA
ncbi:LacI family transcriptional regulator [Streptomyces sp. NBC_00669]|uniref:LacI family DNA-binding transcriptional regulator n=1 Tax=Streptomyces sp. NBC_00669 TaxID=2976011 RepID=UPI002E31CC7C|nr:LacI family DNA-binding transcriptional regulator [Streptomyces sp. NBC_00669]